MTQREGMNRKQLLPRKTIVHTQPTNTDPPMKTTKLLVLTALLGMQLCASQHFFEKVSGHEWQGKGQLMGSDASFTMDWTPILGGSFYRLTFQNEREASKGYVFKAIGIYQIKEGQQVSGTWFDSRGFSFPLRGEVSDDQLIVLWGTPELEEGKTIYTIQTNSTLSVEDYIVKDGELKKFGNAEYVGGN